MVSSTISDINGLEITHRYQRIKLVCSSCRAISKRYIYKFFSVVFFNLFDLIRCCLTKACEWILKPRDNDTPEMQRVREHWWEHRQAKEALALLQRHDRGGRSIESKLLTGLSKYGPNDYVNSLENVSNTSAFKPLRIWCYLASVSSSLDPPKCTPHVHSCISEFNLE